VPWLRLSRCGALAGWLALSRCGGPAATPGAGAPELCISAKTLFIVELFMTNSGNWRVSTDQPARQFTIEVTVSL
jgi:hypothetical protein